ncbi:hypothetical protein BUE80_DR006385 [Diplocarpon rosae]|nr:hypothetical protein BUE80_DR006385 [Diplocarpon rosae]
MQFSNSFIAAGLFVFVASSPMPKKHTAATTSASASSATGVTGGVAAPGTDVLEASAYNDFQISTGVGGDAESKANALFSRLPVDLSQVTANDLEIIQGVHDAAEDAEVQGFNPAIAAASGTDADALSVGKIQNKVLKLTAEVLGIKIETAQGGDSSDLAAEEAKLTKNIATDKASAGAASQSVDFSGTS